MIEKNNIYSEKDIKVLDDRSHVRLRLPIYAGNTELQTYYVPFFVDTFKIELVQFVPASYRCIGEVLDNAIDELIQINKSNKTIIISADPDLGIYSISDNGRGVPIGIHSSGRPTPEIVFGSLRSGRNFIDTKERGVIGQNGMGVSITNYCSTMFTIEIVRDGKKYRQVFTNGALNVSEPTIKKTTKKETGTLVEFILDKEVFRNITLPPKLLENRAIEIALANPGITTEYNGKRFKYQNGFEDLIKTISKDYFKFNDPNFGEFFIIFDCYEGMEELMFTWVNSSMLFDGGLCNTQFINTFYDKISKYLEPAAKKSKCEITKNDIRRNILIFGNLRITNPLYDAQSKTRLTGPNLRKEFSEMIENMWTQFTRKNKQWLDIILERSIIRHHTIENKRAIKNHQKKLRKKVRGLTDATSTNRHKCQLLITEGESASGQITEVRDPETTATLPLTGKINNVYGTTIAQLLKMGKVADLITAIGLVPGQKAIRSTLNYGRIVVATDSDSDGSHITVLLVNLFYTFWPELFDPNYPPFIFRLVAPNIVASKENKRIHFTTKSEYERKKGIYKNWTIEYMKGLGSMIKEDWEKILSKETDTLIPIIDDGKMKEVLELLFGPNTDRRKEWLQHQPTTPHFC